MAWLFFPVSAASAQDSPGQDRAQEARHRAECRLAHQVLTHGQPAVKRDWALTKIGTCQELGGEAIASELDQFRSSASRTEQLEQVVLVTHRFVDREIAETALDIAADPSAGEVARIQAIRVLSFQISPGTNARYESFVQPTGTVFIQATEPVVTGEPLADDISARIHDILTEVATDASTPQAVKIAARNVAEQALAENR